MERDQAGQFLLCSGYLFAFRRALIAAVPPDALAEDAVISHQIAGAGYRIRYAPEAQVFVRYPTTYRDWLRQKVRSTGGYAQDYIRKSPFSMRSAQLEVAQGTRLALAYPRDFRELIWTLLLFAARLHLWLLVFWNVRLRRRPLKALWQRVETTKGLSGSGKSERVYCAINAFSTSFATWLNGCPLTETITRSIWPVNLNGDRYSSLTGVSLS